jgi:hypothetical protein
MLAGVVLVKEEELVLVVQEQTAAAVGVDMVVVEDLVAPILGEVVEDHPTPALILEVMVVVDSYTSKFLDDLEKINETIR